MMDAAKKKAMAMALQRMMTAHRAQGEDDKPEHTLQIIIAVPRKGAKKPTNEEDCESEED